MLVKVALAVPCFDPFIYAVPDILLPKIKVGIRVVVPLRNQPKIGIITQQNIPNDKAIKGIKQIIDTLDQQPFLTSLQLQFISWLSQYYITSLGEIMQTLFSHYQKPVKKQTLIINHNADHYKRLSNQEKEKLQKMLNETATNQQINAYLKKGILKKRISFQLVDQKNHQSQIAILIDDQYKPRQGTKLALLFDKIIKSTTKSILIADLNKEEKNTIHYLKRKQVIKIDSLQNQSKKTEKKKQKQHFKSQLTLNEEQKKIIDRIQADWSKNLYRPYLLHGVTGSGKTEIYKNLASLMMQKK